MTMGSRHRPRVRLSWAGGLAAAWALFQLGCTAYPSGAPAEPAFDTDVRPIFEAHCTRCHGAGPDGGALNTTSTPNWDGGLGCITSPIGPNLTGFCALDSYGNKVCPPDANPGAAFYATLKGSGLHEVLHESKGTCLQMPPPPAPALNEWELAVVDAWIAESNLICSRSSNPDPAALCP
jgi:hypothetical protein